MCSAILRGVVVSRSLTRMFSSKHSYEEAVRKLNSLQSLKARIEEIVKEIKAGKRCTNMEDMENYLLRTGVTLSDLDQLSVIHVAGTKGKGSTSAMCESILRRHGFRTGFYSSPHLVAVRERIRLGGRVMSEENFARHFHRVYDKLEASQAFEGDMPTYFLFLTVLAYNVFLQEKVDVAVVEVGIGGALDATNVIRKVPVVGITALGLDHTAILGNTLPQIAAAKAGIMKPGCEAFTVRQPPEAMEVLRRVAGDVKCTLNVVPDYKSYTFPNGYKTHLQNNLDAFHTNASLAIQLAHSWLRINQLQTMNLRNALKRTIVNSKVIQNGYKNLDAPYGLDVEKNLLDGGMVCQVPAETAQGLSECKWPGRYHVVDATYAKFYLDGAHTKESIEICASWFSDNNRNQDKILIFSVTGDRKPEILLKPLADLGFTHVYFVVPTAHKAINEHNDNYSKVEQADFISRCERNAEAWKQLNENAGHSNISVLECVHDALVSIKNNNKNCNVSVLVTGSLHLVGATLCILDPNLNT
ncbi:folylpolyglutamate synthase, mitochondrial-like isoform X1 [Ostrinia furnacalis]|uniref:folylpolyglutamate synthase, mitochondrial-like isoform X1 n=2 Tax=Ostrinia furnacalis TaxID=93504 RepID=UPI00103C94E5|nr:folylpolyglutamate synthase, mitochondrial-like isoform X1 [Ostrinia furnacalis]